LKCVSPVPRQLVSHSPSIDLIIPLSLSSPMCSGSCETGDSSFVQDRVSLVPQSPLNSSFPSPVLPLLLSPKSSVVPPCLLPSSILLQSIPSQVHLSSSQKRKIKRKLAIDVGTQKMEEEVKLPQPSSVLPLLKVDSPPSSPQMSSYYKCNPFTDPWREDEMGGPPFEPTDWPRPFLLPIPLSAGYALSLFTDRLDLFEFLTNNEFFCYCPPLNWFPQLQRPPSQVVLEALHSAGINLFCQDLLDSQEVYRRSQSTYESPSVRMRCEPTVPTLTWDSLHYSCPPRYLSNEFLPSNVEDYLDYDMEVPPSPPSSSTKPSLPVLSRPKSKKAKKRAQRRR
jgi:hypothetical protein